MACSLWRMPDDILPLKPVFAAMIATDWPEVRRIYQEGIATGHGTFEAAAPDSWADFIKTRIPHGCIVARDDTGAVAGWAVLSAFSARKAYAGVAEAGVYVAAAQRGRGLGSALLAELIRVAEAHGYWTLQGATFPENAASIALQQRHGFRIVGRRERIGRMPGGPQAGQWRDTVLLERRSRVVGVD